MVGYAFATRKNYTKLLKWSTRFACWLIKQYTVFVYFSFFQNQNEQWTHWLLHTYICTELSWLNIYLKTKYITIAIITIFVFKTNFLEVYICGLTIKWFLWVSRDLWNFENKQKQKYFPKLKRSVRTPYSDNSHSRGAVKKWGQRASFLPIQRNRLHESFCREGPQKNPHFAVPKGSITSQRRLFVRGDFTKKLRKKLPKGTCQFKVIKFSGKIYPKGPTVKGSFNWTSKGDISRKLS